MLEKQEIHERIKAIRKRFEASSSEFSKFLGIDEFTYGEIESGKVSPSMQLIQSMAKRLNVNLNFLILGIGDMFTINVNQGESLSNIAQIESREFLKYFENSSILRFHIMGYFTELRLMNREAILEDIHKNNPDFQPLDFRGKKSIKEQDEMIIKELFRYYEASPVFRDLIHTQFKELYMAYKEYILDEYFEAYAIYDLNLDKPLFKDFVKSESEAFVKDECLNTPGKRIKKIREFLSLTQKEMAERLEMSRSNYSRIERAENIPKFSFIANFTRAFRVRMEYITSGSGEAFSSRKININWIISNLTPHFEEFYKYFFGSGLVSYEMLRHFKQFFARKKEVILADYLKNQKVLEGGQKRDESRETQQ